MAEPHAIGMALALDFVNGVQVLIGSLKYSQLSHKRFIGHSLPCFTLSLRCSLPYTLAVEAMKDERIDIHHIVNTNKRRARGAAPHASRQRLPSHHQELQPSAAVPAAPSLPSSWQLPAPPHPRTRAGPRPSRKTGSYRRQRVFIICVGMDCLTCGSPVRPIFHDSETYV